MLQKWFIISPEMALMYVTALAVIHKNLLGRFLLLLPWWCSHSCQRQTVRKPTPTSSRFFHLMSCAEQLCTPWSLVSRRHLCQMIERHAWHTWWHHFQERSVRRSSQTPLVRCVQMGIVSGSFRTTGRARSRKNLLLSVGLLGSPWKWRRSWSFPLLDLGCRCETLMSQGSLWKAEIWSFFSKRIVFKNGWIYGLSKVEINKSDL